MMLKIVAVLLALLPLPALAQVSEGHLTMSGTGRVDATPDIMRAVGGIYIKDDSAAEALEQATERLESLAEAMKPFGTVTTSQVSLGQDRSRSTSLIGSGDADFSARATVTVTLAEPDKAGEVLDAFVEAGIDGVARLQHDIAVSGELLREAREKAVADAVERAETYARAAGLVLGTIVDLSETGSANDRMTPTEPYGARSSYGAKGAPGPVSMAVTATVRIRWSLLLP